MLSSYSMHLQCLSGLVKCTSLIKTHGRLSQWETNCCRLAGSQYYGQSSEGTEQTSKHFAILLQVKYRWKRLLHNICHFTSYRIRSIGWLAPGHSDRHMEIKRMCLGRWQDGGILYQHSQSKYLGSKFFNESYHRIAVQSQICGHPSE